MRTIRVKELAGRDSMFIAGHNARTLIVECGGRPMWSRTHQAWMTSVRIGSDVVARAEADGWDVKYAVLEVGGVP